MNRSYISLILASLIVTQSVIPVNSVPVNIKKADTYITRLKRGIKCYWHRKPCSPEDAKTVNRTIVSAILIILAAGLGTGALYYASKTQAEMIKQITTAINTLDPIAVEKSIQAYEKMFGTKPETESIIWALCKRIATLEAKKNELKKELEKIGFITEETNKQLKSYHQVSNTLQKAFPIIKIFIDLGYDPDKVIDFYTGESFTLRSKLPTLNLSSETLQQLGLVY